MIERKSVAAEFKLSDSKTGEFEALFAVFDNLDRQGDIIRKGAFVPAFESDPNPPIVWSHQWDIPPIGETLEAGETDKGARGVGRLFVDEDHPTAKQVHAAMKTKSLKQYSFAYEIADGGFILREPTEDEPKSPRWDGMIREITKISDVFEWGPTLVGANPATETLQDPKAVRELLGLRDLPDDLPIPLALGKSLEEIVADLVSHFEKAEKSGARNAGKDLERLQQIHDLSVTNGAVCETSSGTEEDSDDGKRAGLLFDVLIPSEPIP